VFLHKDPEYGRRVSLGQGDPDEGQHSDLFEKLDGRTVPESLTGHVNHDDHFQKAHYIGWGHSAGSVLAGAKKGRREVEVEEQEL
jgi:hypothetical protein